MEIWLSFNNREETLQLPVVPFFTISNPVNNHVINLHAVGDVNMAGNLGLSELEITSFFPDTNKHYAFAKESLPPMDMVQTILKWRASRRPVRLIITEIDFNKPMLIEDFQYGHEDKSGDIYYSLQLKEFIFVEAPKMSTDGATTGLTATANENTGLKEWRIVYGDTLSGISLSVFGDSSRWKDIYKWNKDMIKNPHSLKAIEGKVIKLVGK